MSFPSTDSWPSAVIRGSGVSTRDVTRTSTRTCAFVGNDLAPVLPPVRPADGHRLKAVRRDERREALPCVELQQLEKRLEAERAGHDRVLVKVRPEEPLVRVHPLRPHDEPEPGRPPGDLERLEPIDHRQGRRRERQSSGRHEAADGRIGRGGRDARELTNVGWFARRPGCRPAQTDLRCERRSGEEAETRLADVDAFHAAQHLQVELLQDHPARSRRLRQARTRRQRPGIGTNLAELGALAVQVTEVQVVLAQEGRPDVRGEPAAGLERGLEEHGEGHRRLPARAEVPGVLRHIERTGDPAARLQDPGWCVDAHDTVDEQIRVAREACEPAPAVERCVCSAEALGGGAFRVG